MSDLINKILSMALDGQWADAELPTALSEDDKTKAKKLLKTDKMAKGENDHARGMRAYFRAVASGRNAAYLLTQKGDMGKGAKHARDLLGEDASGLHLPSAPVEHAPLGYRGRLVSDHSGPVGLNDQMEMSMQLLSDPVVDEAQRPGQQYTNMARLAGFKFIVKYAKSRRGRISTQGFKTEKEAKEFLAARKQDGYNGIITKPTDESLGEAKDFGRVGGKLTGTYPETIVYMGMKMAKVGSKQGSVRYEGGGKRKTFIDRDDFVQAKQKGKIKAVAEAKGVIGQSWAFAKKGSAQKFKSMLDALAKRADGDWYPQINKAGLKVAVSSQGPMDQSLYNKLDNLASAHKGRREKTIHESLNESGGPLQPRKPATVRGYDDKARAYRFTIFMRSEPSISSKRWYWDGSAWADKESDAKVYKTRKEASPDLRASKKKVAALFEDYTAGDLDSWWQESRPKLVKGGKATRLTRMNGCIKSLRALRDGGVVGDGMSKPELNPVPKKERDSEDQPMDDTPGMVDEAAPKSPPHLAEKGRQRDEIRSIGKQTVGAQFWAEGAGSDKYQVGYKDNRDANAYNDKLKKLAAAYKKVGYKVRMGSGTGTRKALYVYHDMKKIQAAKKQARESTHFDGQDIEEMTTMTLNDAITRFRSLDEANLSAPAVSRKNAGGKQFSPKSKFKQYAGPGKDYTGKAASIPSDAAAKAAMSHSAAVKGPVGPDGREYVDVRVESMDPSKLVGMLEQIAAATDTPEEFARLIEQHLGFDAVVNALAECENVDDGEVFVGRIFEHAHTDHGPGNDSVQETEAQLRDKGMGMDDFDVHDGVDTWDEDQAFADDMMGIGEANTPAPKTGKKNAAGKQFDPKSGFRKPSPQAKLPADKEAMAAMSHSAGVAGPGYGPDGREEIDVRSESRAPREPSGADEIEAFARSMTYPTKDMKDR